MHTIISGLLAGFVVGVVCIIYVLARTRKMEEVYEAGDDIPYSTSRASVGLMIMGVFSSGSMVWGFVGAGLYHMIRAELFFFVISLSLAVVFTLLIWRSNTTFARDKVLLTLIVFVGLGLLIPFFYDTLKIFD
ncbi:MAG: hypothetical protein ONB46_22285 [candidate division KSB1 bacterium]|nr:hypothetical protein [candidate division KSB1 bacterium]MDZ7368609.1 hypothetical protein [candidate division KSB1 bacterium]MDZ7406355.1 hypothetical protein [candidate division KSB1 bacterium]